MQSSCFASRQFLLAGVTGAKAVSVIASCPHSMVNALHEQTSNIAAIPARSMPARSNRSSRRRAFSGWLRDLCREATGFARLAATARNESAPWEKVPKAAFLLQTWFSGLYGDGGFERRRR